MEGSRRHCGSFIVLVMLSLFCAQRAQADDREIEALKKQIAELIKLNQEQQQQIDALEQKVNAASATRAARGDVAGGATEATDAQAAPTPATAAASANAALDAAVGATAPEPSPSANADIVSRRIGRTNLRLIDVSLDTLVAAGTSTAPNDTLRELQGGGHDPDQRGFTLQQAEVSFAGAVDPYLNGEAHVVFTTDGVELEEAFMTTQALPYGLQLKGGHFFTEYGLINPMHPHAWDWIDQPVINTRLFGGDGLRAPGVRLAWLTPLPWFSEVQVGMQNADEDETTASFINGDGIGGWPTIDRDVKSMGDLLYLARWNNAWNLTDTWTALFGVSGLHGPNATGADDDTWIYGADLKVRWRPHENFRGWPFFIWQSELSKRDYAAGASADPALPATILRDAGFYSQALYGFHPGWAAGLRAEYASGSGQSVIDGTLVSRQQDPTRGDRFRLAPLLVWQPTEYSRFRLQYNYDDADFIHGGDAHTFWIGAEVLYGAHPAHKY